MQRSTSTTIAAPQTPPAATVSATIPVASSRRRVVIAVFVLLANLVHTICNGATVAGRFRIGQDLGIRDVRLSNWVAASYPYVKKGLLKMPTQPRSLPFRWCWCYIVGLLWAPLFSSAAAWAPYTATRTCCCLAVPGSRCGPSWISLVDPSWPSISPVASPAWAVPWSCRTPSPWSAPPFPPAGRATSAWVSLEPLPLLVGMSVQSWPGFSPSSPHGGAYSSSCA